MLGTSGSDLRSVRCGEAHAGEAQEPMMRGEEQGQEARPELLCLPVTGRPWASPASAHALNGFCPRRC